jgi:TolA-binding protein
VIPAAPVLTLLAAATLWPFGRDGGDDENHEPTIDELAAADVVVDTTATIPDSQARAIDSYRVFIELAGDDPILHAEAMRRLADLQLDASELDELEHNVASVVERFAGAAELYEALLSAYPRYEKNDLVLYQLARAHELEGDLDSALDALDRLVAEYPGTVHYAEAQFRRGEILFVKRRYDDAELAYRAVLGTSDEQFREQSLYKEGWSLFRQERYADSLEPFFGLLDRKLAATDDDSSEFDPSDRYALLGRADQELVDDTFRVVSINFSYIAGPRSVTDYFNDNGSPAYAYLVYDNLGELYLENERYQDAAAAFEAFADIDAYHAKAPLLQAQVIRAYESGGFVDLVLTAKRAFVERYGPDSPYWQQFSYTVQPEAVAYLKANLMDLAAYYHADAQRDENPASYRLAARWYRDYLAAFPSDPDSAHTNFLLAEVLFESGDLRAAVAEYEKTAYDYPLHAESAEAGFAALVAYDAIDTTLVADAREPWLRLQINSALRFANVYPAHAQADAAMTDAAERLFALGEVERARDVGLILLAREPESSLQRVGWTIVAHSAFDLGRFAEAERAYVELGRFPPRDDSDRVAIVERLASSVYKQGELARMNGDHATSVEHFLRVAQVAPASSVVPTARYDAAADLLVLEDWSRAIAVLDAFRRDYPTHEYAADVTAKLAVAYMSSGNELMAAAEFERIAAGEEPADVRKEALWQAATLYRGGGQLADASRSLGHYVELYPRPSPVAIEAMQQLIEIAEETGDYPSRTRWLSALVDADASAGTERTDRTRYLAAHAAFQLAVPARDAFAAARLVAPLQDSLAVKRERMETALAAFGRAADYGVAKITTAATYEIAELYHGLSRDLFESERPVDLSALELDQYEILLEEQAFPFEEQAIELHEVNAARTAEGVYDEAVRKSLAALAELLPVRYAKSEMGEPYAALQ